MADTRIYVVGPRFAIVGEPIPNPRLVRAVNAAQALRHVTRDFSVTLAGQEELVDIVGMGVKVEDAKVAPEDPPT
jgi:hypothetical protein